MAYKTKNNTSFADIISFCNETKSERGHSPVTNKGETLMETLSLRSKSPSTFSGENNAWTTPVQKEAIELSSRKRNAVLNMIVEKNWKINLRSKIETDLSNQVQQALAPLTTLRRRAEKKKTDRSKNLQVYKVNAYNRNRFAEQYSSQNNGSTGSNFKYIDVNYIPRNKFLPGRSDGFLSRDCLPKSLSNLRLPKRNEFVSQSMYQLDEMARAQKHASNIRGGLDVTLLDSHSNVNFLSLPKHGDGDLRPLIPNAISYNGISLPNYGASRRCFQTYTKEGMNNLLNSRARRGKLTHLGEGRFIDKRGVIISRLGPFWPQGYGPVCQCPEFITDCPEHEDLSLPSDEQKNGITSNTSKNSVFELSSGTQMTSVNINCNPNLNHSLKSRNAIDEHLQIKSQSSHSINDTNNATLKHESREDVENQSRSSHLDENHVITKQPINSIDNINGENTYSNSGQSLLKTANQLSPRDGALKPPNIQLSKRVPPKGGRPQWKGKPVIYDCDRSSRTPLPHSVPEGLDESLIFESRFESGNLRQVRRIGETEYELVLRTDMYTNRHTQWYYFRLQKAKQHRAYKFNIINFLKKDSLYNYGMKPLVYSEKLAANYKLGWHRIGEKIRYAPWTNPTRNAILSLDMQYYCLEFEVTFDWDEIDDDTVYLAHCYPYTYSDLRRHLDQVMSNPDLSQHVKKEVLCETTAGNACFLLTITEFPDSAKDKYKDFHQEKQGVVITARVHPGETQSSWMMKGVIEHLISDDPVAKQLREKFVFKIVPMLNPDGVIVGNYRTSLAARDLNRNYRHPRQEVFPTIWHTKQMVDQFNKDHPIILYCDLHGHSRKHMVFMYGCERKAYYQPPKSKKQNGDKNPEKPPPEKPTDPLNETRDFVEERMFPWLMHKLVPTSFSFHGTKFAVRRSKESTGRVVMFRQMKIWNSFTMEASFSGTRMNKGSGRHFNIDDFQLIGRKLCDCVLEYSTICHNPVAKSRAIMEMTRSIAQQLLQNNKFLSASSDEPVADVRTSNNNNQTSRQPQQNRSKFNKNVNDSLPNFNHIKSTIAKQIRRSKPASKSDLSMSTGENRDVTAASAGGKNKESNSDVTQRPLETESSTFDAGNEVCDFDDTERVETNQDKETENLDLNCLRLLQSLNVHQIELESETSSESNSDSEPELPAEVGSTSAKLRSHNHSNGGKKKKKRKRQQKYGKSISAPSKIQSVPSGPSKRIVDDSHIKENKSKANITNYPGYVNKYANRSNGGIPIFSQERMEERAARRLTELKIAEKDRRVQENQLREQLLLAGIQDGPNISYDLSMSKKLSDENVGYSDVCGVRYKVSNHLQKVQYMLSNPYRSQSPTTARERRPVVSMRFSPPSQIQQQQSDDGVQSQEKLQNGSSSLYMPYRVRAAAGRLSNQRAPDNSLIEFLESSSGSNRTEQSSSRSSETAEQPIDGSAFEPRTSSSPANSYKLMEPRSVVVPVRKYNVSFKMHRKSWKQKPNGNSTAMRSQETDESDLRNALPEAPEFETQSHPPNVSELVLPPNMDAAEVMSAHMRYPAQIHRIEAMRPLPRGRTISRGPPMVFGEPAPFNMKSQEVSAAEQGPELPQRLERSLTNPSLLTKQHVSFSNANLSNRDDVIRMSRDVLPSEQVSNDRLDSNGPEAKQVTGGPQMNSQSLFVPRFVALPPNRDQHSGEETDEKQGLADRSSDKTLREDSNQPPYTVR